MHTSIRVSERQNHALDLFERQVIKTPEHVAVVFEGKQINLQRAQERSNKLGSLFTKQRM
jgi:non-ribosomal peptide synthetase component F